MKNKFIQYGLVIMALVAHAGLVLRKYPLAVLLRGDIPLNGDVSRYFAMANASANVSGSVGYDPYFMAGYPTGVWNSIGKKGFEILNMALPAVPLPIMFYVAIVVLCIVGPLIVWFTLRPYCPTRRSSAVLFFICLTYWHLSTQVSYFWHFGNVFFPVASCLLIPAVVLAHEVVAGKRAATCSLLLGVTMAAVFYGHTAALVAVILPLTGVLFSNRRQLASPRPWLLLSGAVVVFLALIAWWAIPLIRHMDDRVVQPKQWLQGGPKHLIMDVFSDRVYRQHFDRNFLFHVAVVLGIAGAVVALRSRKDSLMWLMGLGGVGCLVITYVFPFIGSLKPIQPYRFAIPAVIFLLGPAALCISRFPDVFQRLERSGKVAVVLILLIMMPEFTAYLIDLTVKQDYCGLRDSQARALDQVRNLPLNGRILCDDSSLGHIIPYFCRKPVIGGSSAQAFLKHRFAGMDDDGLMFGRAAGEWPHGELKEYLDAYAVEYAVFSMTEWVGYADRKGSPFQLETVCGPYRIYRVHDARPELAFAGKASVETDYDVIRAKDVSDTNLVLKLHYADWLVADCGVELAPEPVLDDPVPFIRCIVPAGVSKFTISRR